MTPPPNPAPDRSIEKDPSADERHASPGLAGKVVLIAGGRRVGADLARLLADRGARVAMSFHRSRDTIERTLQDVRDRGADGLAVGADLTRPDEAERAVAQVVERFGRLDALVNMTSAFRRTPWNALSPRDFDSMVSANLAAPYHTAIAAARAMLKGPSPWPWEGLQGKIVNFGDWATERPYRDYLPYLVAKGGLTTLTLALARELAPRVAVAMIQPAMIDPPPDLSTEDIQAVIEQTPLRRVGSANDVNQLVLYLIGTTNFVTGACFRVDGGRFLGVDG